MTETHTVGIGDQTPIARTGTATEEPALLDLIDFSETSDAIEPHKFEHLRASITPWVAQQAGCYAELLRSRGNIVGAIRMAELSIIAASLIRDTVRLSANMLTMANLYYAQGQPDEARRLYETALSLPAAGASAERIGAHQGLANYHTDAKQYHDAAYHLDKYLPFIAAITSPTATEGILRQALAVYANSHDIAGILFCTDRLGDPLVKKFEDILSEQAVSIDEALLIVGRLRNFGALTLAQRLRDHWRHLGRFQ